MANLKQTTIDGDLEVGKLLDTSGNEVDIDGIDSDSRYLRHIYSQYNSTSYTMTGWINGPSFPATHTFKGNSLILLYYYSPNRNNINNWGGMYLEPQVQFDGGSWQSLGSSGYDGAIMIYDHDAIASYDNHILINPNISTNFTAGFRFNARDYNGTSYINGSHSINSRSGTAPLMSGNNGNQHYFHIIVEEYALFN
jgi:hypothetical protein